MADGRQDIHAGTGEIITCGKRQIGIIPARGALGGSGRRQIRCHDNVVARPDEVPVLRDPCSLLPPLRPAEIACQTFQLKLQLSLLETGEGDTEGMQ